jgi:hypothetical protein
LITNKVYDYLLIKVVSVHLLNTEFIPKKFFYIPVRMSQGLESTHVVTKSKCVVQKVISPASLDFFLSEKPFAFPHETGEMRYEGLHR